MIDSGVLGVVWLYKRYWNCVQSGVEKFAMEITVYPRGVSVGLLKLTRNYTNYWKICTNSVGWNNRLHVRFFLVLYTTILKRQMNLIPLIREEVWSVDGNRTAKNLATPSENWFARNIYQHFPLANGRSIQSDVRWIENCRSESPHSWRVLGLISVAAVELSTYTYYLRCIHWEGRR